MHQLAAGQGIDPETLDAALSEALRLAYLKTPHAAKRARVELDPRAGSFTVWAQDETCDLPRNRSMAQRITYYTRRYRNVDCELSHRDRYGGTVPVPQWFLEK